MATKFASLFVEMGADSTKLEAGLKRAKSSLADVASANKRTGFSFTELHSALSLASQGLDLVVGGFQAVLELGRQGTGLEYASQKFDRLAVSVGTTADALKKDLKSATSGMVSDMEIMASAGDFMALGLAKSRDEVVRLTRVAGALGMNMNQLVLTLTNQTTMRFDALGVSVDGFDEKVKKLKDAGMSANDAFKEAFLQQAEAQILKVGDKAETSAGKIARLDASMQNLGDTFKMSVAPGIADAADETARLLTNLVRVQERLGQGGAPTTGPRGYYMNSRYLREFALSEYEQSDAAKAGSGRYAGQAAFYEEQARAAEQAAEKESKAVIKTGEAYDYMRERTRAHQKTMRDSLEIMRENASVLERNAINAENVKQKMDEFYTAQQNVKTAQEEFNQAQQDWNRGAGGDAANTLKDGYISADRYREGLGAIDEVFGTSYGKQEDYNRALKEAGDEYRKTGDLDAYKTKLGEIKETYGGMDEKILAAKGHLEEFKAIYDGLSSKTLELDVVFNYKNPPPGLTNVQPPENKSQRHGGERDGASGLDFTVPSGYPNDSFRVNVQSGEHVTVTPAGQGSAGQSVNIGNITLPGVRDVQGFMRELGKLTANKTSAGASYAGGGL